MKRLLYLVCFLSFGLTLRGQTFSKKELHQIDSLFAVAKNVKAADTSRAAAYVGLSEILYVVDVDTIITLCAECVKIAEINLQLKLNDKERSSFLKSLGSAYNNIGYVYDEKGDYELALDYYNKGLEIQVKIGDLSGQATALNNMGFLYKYKGDIPLALEYYQKSFKIRKQIGENEPIANSLNNLAAVYTDQGNIAQALDYYHQSLLIYEQMNDKIGQALLLNNIGYINLSVGDIDVAQEFYYKSLLLRKQLNDQKGISNSYSNIGLIFKKKGYLDSALFYYQQALEIDREIGFKQGEAASLINLGSIYISLGDTLKAKGIFQEGLELNQMLEEKNGIAVCLHNLAAIALFQGDVNKAIDLSKQSLAYAEELGFPKEIREASGTLYAGYRKKKQWQDALLMLELYTKMKDSLLNEENTKLSIKQQFKYSYDKQVAADSVAQAKEMEVKNAELALKNAETENQKLLLEQSDKLRRYLFLVIGLIALFAVFMYNRFKVTKNQKDVIDLQRKEVEEKKRQIELQHHQLEETHQEISDSIKYAQRLQTAILPPLESLKQNLGDGFVLFKPKDVVSGDFYWMQRIGNRVLFASADCTGHGVPGAMVSIVCSNALNRAVKEFNCVNTDDVLNKTREIVIDTFARSGMEVHDGMDISICAMSLLSDGKIDVDQGLEFSGANNPLWIVRKKTAQEEIEASASENAIMLEYKGDKQPVGAFRNHKPFTRTKVQLIKEDIVFIFTDGYADQFGGDQGKKLKYKPFKDLLLSISSEEMNEQRNLIDDFFNKWKRDFDQVDDICVVGVRV